MPATIVEPQNKLNQVEDPSPSMTQSQADAPEPEADITQSETNTSQSQANTSQSQGDPSQSQKINTLQGDQLQLQLQPPEETPTESRSARLSLVLSDGTTPD